MQFPKRLDRKGSKQIRTRIEELKKISIQDIVTNKPWAEHSVFDHDGNKIDFLDERVDGHEMLSVYVNGFKFISYPLFDRAIPGWATKRISCWDRNRLYYVIVDGRPYKFLYVDKKRKLIGSRHSLGAVYTSVSVANSRAENYWRQRQAIK